MHLIIVLVLILVVVILYDYKTETLLNIKEVKKLDLEADYFADLRANQRRVNEFDKFDTQRQREKRNKSLQVRKDKLGQTSVSWRDGIKKINTSEYNYVNEFDYTE